MSDIERIVPFLLEANRVGYASDKLQVETLDDGTHQIVFEQGENRFVDVWWGGNPFAGQESVAVGGKVLWAMQYRGWMESGFEELSSDTFVFLRHALKECSAEEPLRGPKEFKEADWLYANSWGYNLENFHGKEQIWKASKHIYTCNYFGGAVDL